MKKLNEYFPNTFLAGLVAIVAIVGLVLYGGGTPAGAIANKVTVDAWYDDCYDNDPDDLTDQIGVVYYGNIEYKDWCVNDVELGGQWFCRGKNNVEHRSAKNLKCPNGCLNGACIK